MNRLDKFFALSWNEKYFLVKAIFWLPVIALMLRLVGYCRTEAWAKKGRALATEQAIEAPDLDQARSMALMIRIAANHCVFKPRCLERSLVLLKFLTNSGIPAVLVLGARRESEEFGAHAWVECGGVAVNDEESIETRFAPFRNRPQCKVPLN